MYNLVKAGRSQIYLSVISLLLIHGSLFAKQEEKEFKAPPATKPVETKVFSICNTEDCLISVRLENKTAFSLELTSNYFDETNYSFEAIKFFKAKDYYKGVFSNPVKIKSDTNKVKKFERNLVLNPLEVKTYQVKIRRPDIELKNDVEYIVLGVILLVGIKVNDIYSGNTSFFSDPGLVLGEEFNF